MHAALTVVDALTIIVPVGKIASFLGKPVAQVALRGSR